MPPMTDDERKARPGRVFACRLTKSGTPTLVTVTSVNRSKNRCTVIGEADGIEIRATIKLAQDGTLGGPDWRRIKVGRDIRPWKDALGPAFGEEILR
jgi:hypothetical protein